MIKKKKHGYGKELGYNVDFRQDSQGSCFWGVKLWEKPKWSQEIKSI